jgi:hypothetical protein
MWYTCKAGRLCLVFRGNYPQAYRPGNQEVEGEG